MKTRHWTSKTAGCRCVALVATLVVCLSLTAWAQDQATLVGTVTDTSGAVVPDAKITVSNPEKGLVRALVTNSSGEYGRRKSPSATM